MKPSLRPDERLLGLVAPPDAQAGVAHLNERAHPSGPSIEARMKEDSTHIVSSLIPRDVHEDDAVRRMTEPCICEIFVQREKRGAIE